MQLQPFVQSNLEKWAQALGYFERLKGSLKLSNGSGI